MSLDNMDGEHIEKAVEKHGKDKIRENRELVGDVAAGASLEQLKLIKENLEELVEEIEDEIENTKI